jgi:hypothetical protein
MKNDEILLEVTKLNRLQNRKIGQDKISSVGDKRHFQYNDRKMTIDSHDSDTYIANLRLFLLNI